MQRQISSIRVILHHLYRFDARPKLSYNVPDVGFIYYHHFPVHLSWTIDYLVSEAKLLSKSKIDFPRLRQFGYAFFLLPSIRKSAR